MLKLTNNPWVIRPALMSERLGVERFTVVNDFGAVAHAVARFDGSAFAHVCGPEVPLPQEGMISVIGPGTGLGVAALLRHGKDYEVIETEGGHVDFAPLDSLEDRILVMKVLGQGELGSAITVRAHKFSKSAEEKIAKAGGKAEVITKSAKD